MSNRKIFRKIAKKNGVSLAELKHEMQTALDYAYKNPSNNENTKSYQKQVPKKGEVPTPDEFVSFAAKEIKNKR